MTDSPAIAIRQYRPEDLEAVLAIFLTGTSHYVDKSRADYSVWQKIIDSSLKTDLADIAAAYTSGGGNFWVATARHSNEKEEVVGMVGLQVCADASGSVELRRMSVKPEYRRYGVGRLLVAHLEKWAQTQAFARVVLSTGASMTQAQKFYQSLLYTHTKTTVLSHEPLFELVHFAKQIC